jgi:hypothetical protein
MNIIKIKLSFLLLLLFFTFVDVCGQTTIWSEDLSSYSGWTGINGSVWPNYTNRNLGDYPAGVSKWSLDVSNCTQSNDNDFVQLVDITVGLGFLGSTFTSDYNSFRKFIRKYSTCHN